MVEKKNLLIADNTTTLVSPWKKNLKTYFNCIEVVGAFEAATKLKSMEIACAIINLSIQSFNGLDVVIKIRDKNRKLPIIVIAEKNDLRFVKNASQFGIHGYFLFPFESEGLFNEVTQITGVSIAQMTNEMEIEKTKKEETKEKRHPVSGDNNIPGLYYEGQSSLLHEDVEKAMEIFNRIFSTKTVKDTARKYWEESIFQLGRCLLKKSKYDDAIEKFNLFMQRAPNSDLYKQAYYLVGESYEKMNNISKALTVFKKLIDMPPFDSISTKARKKAKSLQGNI